MDYVQYYEEYNTLKELKVECCNNCKSCYYDGYITCINCAVVLSYMVYEDHFYPQEMDDQPKVLSFIQKGSFSYVCKNGQYIKSNLYNLNIQNNYSSKQRATDNVANIIDNCLSIKYHEKIKEMSKVLWSEIGGIKKGAIRIGLIMCCVYYSCIYYRYPRSAVEISADFGQDITVFNKGNKEFKKIFSEHEKWSHIITDNMSSDYYISMYCGQLENLSEEDLLMVRKEAIKINAKRENEVQCRPNILGAAIVFLACEKKHIIINKKQYTKLLGISYQLFNSTLNVLKSHVV